MAHGSTTLDANVCWNAVLARDASADGRFVYGVLSTGIYCRASCASRRPNRDNIRFYADAQAAEAAGFRPCLRCGPRGSSRRRLARIHDACRYIESHAGENLSLQQLAARAHLSASHFREQFCALVGVSPRRYVQAVRLRALKRELRSTATVSGAIAGAGFGSDSRVYERADSRIGMTPRQYRDGGRGLCISYATRRTSIGRLIMGATDRGICFVQFGDDRRRLLDQLRAEYPAARLASARARDTTQMARWMRALERHLAGGHPALQLPLDVRGTVFQIKVWEFLQRIPPGSVRSYADVAAGIGRRRAVRAVARACAANPVAVLIPCHRVIRGDGTLGGYRWGLRRKRALLQLERIAPTGRRRRPPSTPSI